MPKFAIIVENPDAEHARTFGARKKGAVHAVADSECPFGRPNCRNCGDPAHAETCAAAGHCPDCGTKHGIAADAIVTRNGYRLEPL